MNFLDHVEINPSVSLTKGKLYPFVEMANISTNSREPIQIDYKEFASGVKFQDGDSVIARIEPCLQNGKKFFCHNIGVGFGSTEYLVFRPKDDKIDNVYLYYLLQTDYIRKKMIGSMTGSTGRQRVNNDVFKSIEIALPEINTQKKIGNILSTYDNLIENNQKQIKLLEEAAQRLYKEWFVNLRFPGYETASITDGIPEKWTRDTVGSIVELQSGFAFKSSDFCNSGTYKIITIKNVQSGLFEGHNVSRIDHVPAKMPEYCRLNDGDILLSLTGNVGRVCIVNGTDYLLNQRVAKISTDYPGYAYCLFRSNGMFAAMGNLANGAAQQNLSPIKTERIDILVPTPELLIHFEAIVNPFMTRMLTANKQIELLKQARDRLLPKLMSGEMEV